MQRMWCCDWNTVKKRGHPYIMCTRMCMHESFLGINLTARRGMPIAVHQRRLQSGRASVDALAESEHMYLGHSILHSKPDYDYQHKMADACMGTHWKTTQREQRTNVKIMLIFAAFHTHNLHPVNGFWLSFTYIHMKLHDNLWGQTCPDESFPLWWCGAGWHWTHINQCSRFPCSWSKTSALIIFHFKRMGMDGGEPGCLSMNYSHWSCLSLAKRDREQPVLNIPTEVNGYWLTSQYL